MRCTRPRLNDSRWTPCLMGAVAILLALIASVSTARSDAETLASRDAAITLPAMAPSTASDPAALELDVADGSDLTVDAAFSQPVLAPPHIAATALTGRLDRDGTHLDALLTCSRLLI